MASLLLMTRWIILTVSHFTDKYCRWWLPSALFDYQLRTYTIKNWDIFASGVRIWPFSLWFLICICVPQRKRMVVPAALKIVRLKPTRRVSLFVELSSIYVIAFCQWCFSTVSMSLTTMSSLHALPAETKSIRFLLPWVWSPECLKRQRFSAF